MSRFHRKALTTALIAAGLTVALGVQAAGSPTIQEQVQVSPQTHLTGQEASALSSAAARVLRHIAEARAALHKQDITAAQTQLGKADTLMDIINATLPTTKVKDRIWVAKKHLEYEDTQTVLPDLVPISNGLDEIEDFAPAPVKKARAHLAEARKQLHNGDKKAANEALSATDAALVYTEVDLPLTQTRAAVNTARQELNKGDTKAADEALRNAEDNVVVLSVTLDAPLSQARESLWQATQDLAAGAVDAVRKDIASAESQLSRVAESADEVTRNTARALQDELQSLKGRLSQQGGSVSADLQRLWEQSAALAERASDLVASRWEQLRYPPLGRNDLVEARLYVHFAQIDQFTGHDARQAGSELDLAVGYLDDAARHVADKHKPAVEQIRKQVKQLIAQVGNQGPTAGGVNGDYVRAIDDLSSLIRTL